MPTRPRPRPGVIASGGLALLAAVGMGVAGCGTGPAAHRYPAGNTARTATTRPPAPSLGSLAARYLLIARPANHRLAGLRGLDGRHRAADAALEAQVRLIRMFLRLPPPPTS
ncbi:MAG: hypothetical protein ACRDRJ_27250 [Streptosporangiaceae bacterium]